MKKKLSNGSKSTLLRLLGGLGIAAAGVFITFNWFDEYSRLAVAFIMSIMGIGIFWWVDTFLLPEINTITELKKGKTAYAIFLLAIAVIIAAAFLAV